MATLPFLIHIAIFLFVAGLALYLWDKTFILSIILLTFLLIGVLSYWRFSKMRKMDWHETLSLFMMGISL